MITSRRRKQLGQHFLIDTQVIDDMIKFIHPREGDTMIEIGPGHGALTERLIHRVRHLFAIELDAGLASKLQASINARSTSVILGDALEFDYSSVQTGSKKIRVVGNLPYSISTQLIINLLDYSECVQDMCFMVQKEVADRLVAKLGSRNYGRLTVNVSRIFDVDTVFDVSPDSFRPRPKVQSTVIYLRPINTVQVDATTVQEFSKLVRVAFGNRRKTLKNSLAGIVSSDVFKISGIDESLRAQNLSVDNFMQLAQNSVGHSTRTLE